MPAVRCPLQSFLLALLVSACAGGGDASDTFDVDDLPLLVLEEEIRIGSVEDPDVGFSRVGAVQVAPDGTVFVLEAQDRQVRSTTGAADCSEGSGAGDRDPASCRVRPHSSSWGTRSSCRKSLETRGSLSTAATAR